jgi:hypothetical protein
MVRELSKVHSGSILPINKWSHDFDYDMPYPLTISMKDLDADLSANLDSILGSVQGLLFEDDDEDTSTLDPTPIGPQGVQFINEVKLTEIPSTEEDQFLTTFLYPLLVPSDNKTMMLSRVTSSKNLPKKKRNSTKSHFKKITATFSPSRKADTTQEGEDAESSAEDEDDPSRFRPYQSEQWEARFQDLIELRKVHGNCLLPRNAKDGTALVRWVSRQRYQQQRKKKGKRSTLTDDRQARLERLGFVWDSHKASWEERIQELAQFQEQYGHCNANGTNNPSNKQLVRWVKCQRKQYRLFQAGKKSSGMSNERISKLESLGFCWDPL